MNYRKIWYHAWRVAIILACAAIGAASGWMMHTQYPIMAMVILGFVVGVFPAVALYDRSGDGVDRPGPNIPGMGL